MGYLIEITFNMLKFFRTIRRKLSEQGKVKSYLIYAIGEIMLIVIGILLALQVTNWNDHQKNKKIERTYLEAMKVEMEANQKSLDRVLKRNNKGIENMEKLIDLLSQKPSDISKSAVSELFNKVFQDKIKYPPNSGILDDIINSGHLKNISNFQLRNIIASWDVYYSQVQGQEQLINDIRETIINLLKRTDHFEGIRHPETGNIVGLQLAAVSSNTKQATIDYTEFKNNLLFLVVTSAALSNNYYSSFQKKLQKTLDLINEELEK